MNDVNPFLTVLFVDDEEPILKSLVRLFINEPFQVITCDNPLTALQLLEKQSVAVVVSDQRMPELEGTEFLSRVADKWPDTVRLLLTGHADYEAAVAAVNQSKVYRFLNKPWSDQELVTVIKQALEHYQVTQDNRRLTALVKERNQELLEINQTLEDKVAQRTREVRKLLNALKKSFSQLSQVFFSLMELYEPDLAGHGRRVAQVATLIASSLQLEEKEVKLIEDAALFHDIGLFGISRQILDSEESELELAQIALLKQHPEMGCTILEQIDTLKPVALLVKAHHEDFSGSGFPDGLQGEKIALGARIIRVANDYDNLVNKKGRSRADALNQLKKGCPEFYDAAVVNVMLTAAELKNIDRLDDIPVTFAKLRPGMVLSRDMRTASGRFLMAKGSVIEAEHLTSLHNFHKFDPIIGHLYVCHAEEYGD